MKRFIIIKNRLTLITFIVIGVFLLSGCSSNEKSMHINSPSLTKQSLIQTMRKDSLVVTFQKFFREEQEDITAGDFDFIHCDTAMINANRKKCKTFNQLVELYDSAGFRNAREYLKLSWGQTELSIVIFKKYHQQLASLSPNARKQVLEATLFSPLQINIPTDTLIYLLQKRNESKQH